MGLKNKQPERNEPENSGQVFQNDMDDLYGQAVEEEKKEEEQED